MLVATWNVEWAARSHRVEITGRIAALDADVLVITEGVSSVLPSGGHTALGGADWGMPVTDPERRKVLLWSRYPLSDITTHEGVGLPPGRLVAATSHTPDGPVRFMGVCIPWAAAHVTTGRRDAARWQEHLQFLEALGTLLQDHPSSMPLVVMGDFNQRIPRARAPRRVSEAMEEVLGPLHVVTAGNVPGLPSGTIDHIAVTADLVAADVFGSPRIGKQGMSLSDHDLAAAHLVNRPR